MGLSLYAQLADQISAQIRDGVFATGSKLPSVRELAKQRRVSVSTVTTAYGQLEQEGWVEVRPKSGYYVKKRNDAQLAPPRQVTTSPEPRPATTSELVMEVQRDAARSRGLSMCAAIPALDFPIIRHVQRVYTQLARTRKYLGIGYDTPEGHYEFRQQIARRGTDAGIHLSPEAIVTTGGAQNALALGLRVLTSPGDIVAVESPCYYGLLQMIEYFGLKAIEVPSHPTTGMSLEALHLALKQWPIKAILTVSNFSNPLGSTIPDDNKRAIAELLETYDVALLEDDVYGELFFGEVRPKTIKSFDQAGRVLYCSSLSKTIDPQLRVGWIAPGRYYKDVSHRKFINSIASPTLPQMVAAEVMAQGIYERHLRHARSVYRQRYQRMLDLVHESFPLETRVSRPEGGLVAWFECPGRVDTTVLYHQLHNEGVTVAPGEIFSLSGQYRNCFRVNYAQEWTPEREAALRQVGHLLKKAIG